MEASELVANLASRLGIELEPWESCSFDADGIVVSINHLADAGALALSSDLGEPPPEKLEGLYKALLGANHMFAGTAGATFSLDPDTSRITLFIALPVASLDGDSFAKAVETFVNTAEMWTKVIADYREGAEIAAAQTAQAEESGETAPAPGNPFSPGGFMQV